MKYFSVLAVFILLFNCKNKAEKQEVKVLTANEIVNKSISVSGGNKFDSLSVSIRFDFRNIEYKANYSATRKTLGRLKVEGNDTVVDILKGELFQRFINGKLTVVADSMASKYSASVNSVHYFSVLPYGLNNKAVNKTLIGEEQIKNQNYYKIKVTFDQNGGGEDFEDVFIYWVNKENFKPDYLAYSYNEDDGKGMRFREAYNERYVEGLRFVDYNNYKSEIKNPNLNDLGIYFNNDALKLVSKIELENVEVDLIDNL